MAALTSTILLGTLAAAAVAGTTKTFVDSNQARIRANNMKGDQERAAANQMAAMKAQQAQDDANTASANARLKPRPVFDQSGSTYGGTLLTGPGGIQGSPQDGQKTLLGG